MDHSVEQPTVHLIGGPPGAGKTTLGIALASRLERSSVTIDDIRTSLLGITDPSAYPELHVIGLPDPVTYFTGTDPETMVEHAIAQHRTLWPAVEAVLRKKVNHGIPAVYDGWHLMPDLVAGAALDGACAVWIDIDDEVLRARELQVWDFYQRSHDPELMLERFLARSMLWNARMRESAAKFGFHLIRQDGTRSVPDLVDEVLGLASASSLRDL